jgi:cyclopropane-fatty-acyl-phospholipid synthase
MPNETPRGADLVERSVLALGASPHKVPFAASIFRSLVQQGTLAIAVGDGPSSTFGGSRAGPSVGIRFSDRRTLVGCALDPELRVGEAYVDGKLRIEDGTLADFLQLALLNVDAVASNPFARAVRFLRGIHSFILRFHPARTARRFVAHHYDLKDELFELFLDEDLQYSCAYFADPHDDLETAQSRKKLRLAAKLLLRPGHRVLDIGSGWGGLAIHFARTEDVRVHGVTLSRAQHARSVRRAQDAGLSGRVRFDLKDYRDVEGTYDRIVSVGMLEHVGRRQLDTYFRKVAELLADDGIALIHAIGSFHDPGSRQPWIEKYIFPGSFLPPLDLVLRAVQGTPLVVTDVEILRLHYAETLKAWRQRFYANVDRIRELYDERFVRMWDLYLTSCEMVFRAGQAMVFQVQLARSPAAAPITRDYIEAFERARTPAVAGR